MSFSLMLKNRCRFILPCLLLSLYTWKRSIGNVSSQNLEIKVCQTDWAVEKHSWGESHKTNCHSACQNLGDFAFLEPTVLKRLWLSKVIKHCYVALCRQSFKTKGELGHFKVNVSLSINTWLPVNTEKREDIWTVLLHFSNNLYLEFPDSLTPEGS